MVDYSQFMLKKFVTNFNEDVVCFFRQGYFDDDMGFDNGPYYANMLSDEVSKKPRGSVFMYVNVLEGVTNNGSIGSDILQVEPFTLQFRTYTPNGSSFKKSNEIVDVLDTIFKGKNFTEDSFCVNADSATPKDTTTMLADASDGYHVKTINYRFDCRYFD